MLKQYPARSACRQTVRPVGLLFFILAAQCLMAQAATWGVSTNLQVEDLGTPVRFTGEQGRVVFRSLKTGELHLLSLYLPYVGIQGRDHPFQIHDLNLTKNQAVIVAGMVGRPAPAGFLFHSNGKVYIGTARPCALLEYDPESHAARALGELSANYYHGVQAFAEGKDGNIYYGTYGRCIGRYNFQTGTNENFGIIGGADNVGLGYVFSIGSDGEYVYCGMGKAPYYLCVYDIKNKTTRDFFKPKGTGNQATKDYYVRKGKDGNLYYPRDNRNHRLQNGRPAEKETKAADLETMLRSETLADDLDVKTSASAVEFETSPGCHPDSAAAQFGVNIDAALANPSSFNAGEVTIRFKQTNAAAWTTSTIQGMPIYPCAVKRLLKLPDGRILGTTPFVGPAFVLDRKTNAAAYLGMLPSSVYDMLEHDGKVYFAGYVNAFAQYDLAKPWTLTASHDAKPGNPKNLQLNFGGKYNYFLAAAKDGRIYAAGHHERDSLGGSLAWYDPRSGESGGLREPLLRHDVSDLLGLNDGTLIVLSAFAVGGAASGRIFVWDAVNHALAATLEPFPELPDTGKIFPAGKDLVMGVARLKAPADPAEARLNLVYKLNVKTGEVLLNKKVPGRFFTGSSADDLLSYDSRFELGPDGCGWLFIDNWLSRIHPADGRIEPILEMQLKGRLLFADNDLYVYNGGRVFFGGFSQVLRIRNVFAGAAGAQQTGN